MLIFPYLWAISIGSYGLIFVVGVLMFGVLYSAANGIWPSFYGEMFSTRVRLSGMAIGTQIGFALSGFAPTAATAIAGTGQAAWLGVALFTAALCLVNIVAVATGRETYRVPMSQLGAKPDPTGDKATAASA